MNKHISPIGAVNVAGMGLVVYLATVLGQTVYHNYLLNRQIETLGSQISLLQAKHDQLKYSIQYYQTDSFKDREARAKLGLQQPGEGVLILPNSHAAAVLGSTDAVAPVKKQSHVAQWLAFLAGNG